MIANGVTSAIQPGISAAGDFAGGAVSSVGSGINGFGESVNGYVRRYGTGVQEYGNSIRDWTGAEGPRAQTAANPLGLSSSKAGGKYGVTSPSLPPALQRSSSTPAAPQKKSIGAGAKRPGQKAIAGTPKKSPLDSKPAATSTNRSAPGAAKSNSAAAKSGGVNPAKGPNSNKVTVSAASKPSSLNKAAASKPAVSSTKQTSASKGKGGVNHLYIGA